MCQENAAAKQNPRWCRHVLQTCWLSSADGNWLGLVGGGRWFGWLSNDGRHCGGQQVAPNPPLPDWSWRLEWWEMKLGTPHTSPHRTNKANLYNAPQLKWFELCTHGRTRASNYSPESITTALLINNSNNRNERSTKLSRDFNMANYFHHLWNSSLFLGIIVAFWVCILSTLQTPVSIATTIYLTSTTTDKVFTHHYLDPPLGICAFILAPACQHLPYI